MWPDRPPHLCELDDRVGGDQQLEVAAEGRPAAESVRNAAPRKAAREGLCARRVQPGEPAVQEGGVRGDRQQQRQQRAHPVAYAHRPVDVAHAHVDVKAEGVVAPGHVAQALLDAAVVLGVDDGLLAVVRPRVRAGRPKLRCARARQREQRTPPLALAAQRVAEIVADARDDLDLRRDQLTGDVLVQQRIDERRRVAQFLEARGEVERLRVEDRKLLFDPDGQVAGRRENLDGAVEVDRRH